MNTNRTMSDTARRRLGSVTAWLCGTATLLLVVGTITPWLQHTTDPVRQVGVGDIAAELGAVTVGGMPLLVAHAAVLVAATVAASVWERPEVSAVAAVFITGPLLARLDVHVVDAVTAADAAAWETTFAVDAFAYGVYAALLAAAAVTVQTLVLRLAVARERRTATTSVPA